MSFDVLNIAGRALAAQQIALDVTGNNMANATTPGYQREAVDLTEAPPAPSPLLPGIPMGQGVVVDAITRASNAFLSRSVRTESSISSYWSAITTALGPIQSAFQEPSPTGLAEIMNQFFSSWLTLSQNPTSMAARQAVIENGKNLASVFNNLAQTIVNSQATLNQTVSQDTQVLNTYGQDIAQLNQAIVSSGSAGAPANDLIDQRGELLNKLSHMVNITYTTSASQEVNVYIGGHPLVVNNQSYSLSAVSNASGLAIPTWTDTSQPVDIQSGQFGGTLAARDQILPGYLSSLNQLASQLATVINNQETQGYQYNSSSLAPAFFSVPATGSITAGSLTVNPNLTPQALGAAANPPGASGSNADDGANALTIANLANQTITALNGTFNDYYTTLVGTVGTQGQHANQQSQTATNTLTALKNALQSATGVDLNQESAHLIQEEQSYTAAAKLMMTEQTVIQSLLAAVS